jgi:hypothetical protein
MAEQEKPKTLELRVAELEQKLAKSHITEEDLRVFEKVATTLGTAGPTALAHLPAAAVPYWIWYQWHVYYWVYYWGWYQQQTPGQLGQPPTTMPPFGGLGKR